MTQKASNVSFNPFYSNSAGMIFLPVRENKGIKDPYSGKIYGEKPYEQLVADVNKVRNSIIQRLSTPTFSMSGSSLDQQQSPSMGNFGQPMKTQKELLTEQLASLFIPKKEDYVFQEKINQSYKQYGDGWDAFFKGNYQNPRIAEEQKNRAVRGQREYESAVAQSTGAVSTNSRVTKRQVGTGVGTSTFNPFGAMEAGLGL